jgi:hypothetical protein
VNGKRTTGKEEENELDDRDEDDEMGLERIYNTGVPMGFTVTRHPNLS